MNSHEEVSSEALAATATLERIRAAVKPVRITGVDIFPVRVPVTDAEAKAGYMNRYIACRIKTDAGVTGYSFAGAASSKRRPGQGATPRQRLVQHRRVTPGRSVALGWSGACPLGRNRKIAGQPVYKLLGGAGDRVNAYLTCVWPGPADQQQVPFADQVGMAVKIRNAGFKGMKIRVGVRTRWMM